MARSSRSKRGVVRKLPALIRALSCLEHDCEHLATPEVLSARECVLENFPWDALDRLRRERQDRALNEAVAELACLLKRATLTSRLKEVERFRAIQQNLRTLFDAQSASHEDLFGSIALTLTRAGLPHQAKSARRRRRPASFYMELKEALVGDVTVIRDLASGMGPKHAARALLSRVCGLSPNVIRKTGQKLAVDAREATRGH